MTNFQIIANAAVFEGLYTEDEALAILEEQGELPLHTFAEWKKRGYIVRKGQRAVLTCQIWRFKGKGKPVEPSEDDEKNRRDFYMTKAFFFGPEQVEQIATA